MKIPKICTNCEGTDLAWFAVSHHNGNIVDGRLKLNEVQPMFSLGCEECSETLLVLPASEIAALLNSNGKILTGSLTRP